MGGKVSKIEPRVSTAVLNEELTASFEVQELVASPVAGVRAGILQSTALKMFVEASKLAALLTECVV